MLLWSDVPRDTIYKWTEEKGKEFYLTPSGYTDTIKRGGEMGSNGLLLDKNGHLVLCQCGNRQIARMNAPLDNPRPDYTTIVDRVSMKKFQGPDDIIIAGNISWKRFNSPNDAVYSDKGDLFFTDPPYGLEKQMDDPKKEIPFQGVYHLYPSGVVGLVTDSLSRPNGVALWPGGYDLLVSNSDPDKPEWWVYYVGTADTMIPPRLFYSAKGYDKTLKGLPDGMKIDKNGNVFATGPGGLWIFNKEGKLLGKLKLDQASSNCALSPDEKTLYITNDMFVLRFKMRD
jgi:gluconolactonase